MPGGYPCECCGCVYFDDDFDRANNTDIGGDWTEAVGDWSISSNQLVTSDSDALCVCNKAHPSSVLPHVVLVKITAANENDEAKVTCSYTDANKYYFALLTWGPAAGDGTVKLYSRAGGVNTQLGWTLAISLGAGDSIWIRLNIDANSICVQTSTDGSVYTDRVYDSATVATDKGGVGTGTIGGEVQFDDFQLSRHHSTDSRCDGCGCDRYCLDVTPSSVQVEIAGIVNGTCPDACAECAGFNGTWILSDKYQIDCSGYRYCLWYTELDSTICGCDYLLLVLAATATFEYIYVAFGDVLYNCLGSVGKHFFFNIGGLGTIFPIDCNAWNEYAVEQVAVGEPCAPPWAVLDKCDLSSATCKLTAL